MRISDALSAVTAVGQTPTATTGVAIAERAAYVSTDGFAALQRMTTQSRTRAANERAARLRELSESVSDGTYHPSAGDLADKMLADAALDGDLRRLAAR